MSPPLRTLGRDGPLVSAIGLGFGSIAGFYGPAGTLDKRMALLEHAHATGLRFWDMADIYGDSEDVVGGWIKRSGKRNDVFLATKFGLQRQPDGKHTFRTDPDYVKAACGKSLERLGVDTIDLYYCHRVDGVTPIEKTVEAMVELKDQGKIRYLGLSDVSAATLRRAHAVHPITALQVEYSLFTLDVESSASETLSTCRELGIAIVAFSPIGRGILTGNFQSRADIPEGDLRRMYPKYAAVNFPEILKLVQALKDVANAHGTTPAQVALAWLLANGPDIIPIPGTKSAARMDENAASALLQLSEEEVQEIRTLAEKVEIEGTRYPAAVMATLSSDTPPLEDC
ncbi:NADP-dependent oxidoreductase domain-containing protein [Aspergillus alliaceus]|uniref:NADP-dependent oxidoreductase domain-containing protein n=1 Tax=Petromyces alliaceus TaxID=209559 RepID=UPI0012A64E2A|nr:NADP-dependent oxidoreductase domain-containing protein [Aspergillus alliaceus]KAB8230901.1 NADP-dependent oxidoreductase domain-containing protein [Aspergillus alliaceus]